MTRLGTVTKIGRGRYRVVHNDFEWGKPSPGNECLYCGSPRRKRTTGKLCSTCKRSPERRRAVGGE